MVDIKLRNFRPDDRDWLVERHGTLYARDEGFDGSFAPLVARILDDFVANHDSRYERGWIAEQAGVRLGSIFCVTKDEMTAQLRLFLLVPEARGKGIGRRLLKVCTDFASAAGYSEMMLWTHDSHRAACALYRASGWRLVASKPVQSFGVDLIEQSWSIRL
ncbi:MAG: GNAT family N-acetyltransferase [Ruegeria sp.]